MQLTRIIERLQSIVKRATERQPRRDELHRIRLFEDRAVVTDAHQMVVLPIDKTVADCYDIPPLSYHKTDDVNVTAGDNELVLTIDCDHKNDQSDELTIEPSDHEYVE